MIGNAPLPDSASLWLQQRRVRHQSGILAIHIM
jgi:hypothetical protein